MLTKTTLHARVLIIKMIAAFAAIFAIGCRTAYVQVQPVPVQPVRVQPVAMQPTDGCYPGAYSAYFGDCVPSGYAVEPNGRYLYAIGSPDVHISFSSFRTNPVFLSFSRTHVYRGNVTSRSVGTGSVQPRGTNQRLGGGGFNPKNTVAPSANTNGFSRPSSGFSRPNSGFSRPSTPSAGFTRPSGGFNRGRR